MTSHAQGSSFHNEGDVPAEFLEKAQGALNRDTVVAKAPDPLALRPHPRPVIDAARASEGGNDDGGGNDVCFHQMVNILL
jgi:hypothetical protein